VIKGQNIIDQVQNNPDAPNSRAVMKAFGQPGKGQATEKKPVGGPVSAAQSQIDQAKQRETTAFKTAQEQMAANRRRMPGYTAQKSVLLGK